MTVAGEGSTPLGNLLGFTRIQHSGAGVVLEAEIRPDLVNRRGVVHGGVLSALLDSALGGAVVAGIDPVEWCATLQLSVQFISGGRRGPLRASGRMTRRGSRCAFAEGEVLDARGKLIARAQGTWYVCAGTAGLRGCIRRWKMREQRRRAWPCTRAAWVPSTSTST